MNVNDYVLAQGVRVTREALTRWNRDPAPVLRAWIAGAVAVSVVLLTAVWAVAALATPDSTPAYIPGISESAGAGDVAHTLLRGGSTKRLGRSRSRG